MNFYIHSSGSLFRDADSLYFQTTEGKKISIPAKCADALYLFGQTNFNTQALWLLGREKILCHIFSWTGNHVSTITPHPEQISGHVTIKQALAFSDPERRLTIAKAIVAAAAHNIHSNHRRNNLPEIGRMEDLAAKITNTREVTELMGLEGNIRRIYYAGWASWLRLDSPFKRQYNPPDNPINCLVSFLNSLAYSTTVSEIYRTCLYPGISYLHEPQSRRYSLALDLAEISKPVLVDRLIASIWNNRQIQDSDFMPHSNGIILKEEARREIVKQWDALIQRTFWCKELNRNISYRGIIRRDCYVLIRHLIEGEQLKFFRIAY